jgi:AraC-like DNA-binding protein
MQARGIDLPPALRPQEFWQDPMIRRTKAYIAGHYADPITLDEIARAISTFYFCKIFKKATHCLVNMFLLSASDSLVQVDSLRRARFQELRLKKKC